MNTELQLWMALTRRLPRIKGAGRTTGMIQRFYARKPRERERVRVLDFEMDLDPTECVDGNLLFAPHLYDHREFALLRQMLRPGEIFVDAGANIGIYTLVASRIVGPSGRVIAIEASETNHCCLRRNCDLNECRNVHCLQIGLSDKEERLRMACSFYGNRSGNSFLKESPIGEWVLCQPLVDVLASAQVKRVDGAKFDIEGFEFKVLQPFFQTAPKSLWPRFMIFEDNVDLREKSGGSVQELLRNAGYQLRPIADQNYLAERKEA